MRQSEAIFTHLDWPSGVPGDAGGLMHIFGPVMNQKLYHTFFFVDRNCPLVDILEGR